MVAGRNSANPAIGASGNVGPVSCTLLTLVSWITRRSAFPARKRQLPTPCGRSALGLNGEWRLPLFVTHS